MNTQTKLILGIGIISVGVYLLLKKNKTISQPAAPAPPIGYMPPVRESATMSDLSPNDKGECTGGRVKIQLNCIMPPCGSICVDPYIS